MHDHHQHGSNQQASQDENRYDEEFWEDRYRSQPAIWSGNPNHVLVAEAAGLTPGTAVDVGCGEGGDAIWLAQQRWKVTAVDFASVALERGAARARDLGVNDRLRWVQADLTTWQPGESYDLVTCHYLHLETEEQADLLLRLAGAVAPGGTLLYVSHFFDDDFAKEHPHLLGRSMPTERIAEILDANRWEIVNAGTRQRPDAGENPAGHAHDNVLRVRRLR